MADFRTALVGLAKSPLNQLTLRQIGLCLLVENGTRETRHVFALARDLGVQRPVITRGADTLEGLGLVRRERDETDLRLCRIVPGPRMSVFMDQLRGVAA